MVVIDILENNSKFIIYSTKLKEVDAPALYRGVISTSSATNISYVLNNMQGKIKKNKGVNPVIRSNRIK